MEQSADTLGAVLVSGQRQEQLGHLIDGQQHGLPTAFNLPENALNRAAQGAVVGVLRGTHFHINACGPHFQSSQRLACLAKGERDPAERLRMESALAQPIDELFGESQLIVAALDVHEHRTSSGLTLQLTQPEHEGGLPHPTWGGEQGVRAIGQLPLQASEIARAVEEVVMFNGGTGDVSHGPEDSRS